MGISNDLKSNTNTLQDDIRSTVNVLKDGAGVVKNDLHETMRDNARDTRREFDHIGNDLHKAGRTFAARAEEGMESAKGGLESMREEVCEASKKISWKMLVGVLAGVVTVAGVILIVRRRSQNARRGLIERGFYEGSRYAAQVPAEWHKAQHMARKAAKRLAKNTARESARLWSRIPRYHLERN